MSSRQAIEDAVHAQLKTISPHVDFSGSADFVEDGLLDSFDIVSLVSALDEQFAINIDGRQILPDNFRTTGAITDLIEHTLAGQRGVA